MRTSMSALLYYLWVTSDEFLQAATLVNSPEVAPEHSGSSESYFTAAGRGDPCFLGRIRSGGGARGCARTPPSAALVMSVSPRTRNGGEPHAESAGEAAI